MVLKRGRGIQNTYFAFSNSNILSQTDVLVCRFMSMYFFFVGYFLLQERMQLRNGDVLGNKFGIHRDCKTTF